MTVSLHDPQPTVTDPREGTTALPPVPVPARLSPLALGLLLALGVAIGALVALRTADGGGSATIAAPTQRLSQAVGGAEPEEMLLFAVTPTRPAAAADLLPAGASLIYAFYQLPGVTERTAPAVKWSKDGKTIGALKAGDVAVGEKPGTGTLTLRPPSGAFAPGIYEVELASPESKLSGSFVTAWGAEAIAGQAAPKDAQVLIVDVTFAAAVTPEGKANKPQKSFWGSQRVYFVFHYAQAEPGSAVQIKWYGGPQQINSATSEVLLPSVEGWANGWLQAPFPGLPAGDYRATVNMSSDPKVLASGDFTIVPGAPPNPSPATPGSD